MCLFSHKYMLILLKVTLQQIIIKSIIAVTQPNEDEFLWNDGVELLTNGNMKFFRRETILSIHAKMMLDINILNEVLHSMIMKKLK